MALASKITGLGLGTENAGLQPIPGHYKVMLYKDKIENVLPTHMSQTLQCDALGGRNILHVKQYFSLFT